MKKTIYTLLNTVIISISLAQTNVNIHLDSVPQQIPVELNPGFFYNQQTALPDFHDVSPLLLIPTD